MENLFVSIIIPVYNNANGLARTLAALTKQEYPSEKYEIIVIDNGSIDNPEPIAKEYNVLLIKETKYLNSPYSARNRGIEIAKGNIIALLDTTCAPVNDWLLQAAKCFSDQNVSLVGGDVRFDVSNASSIGEIYDSLTNIRMKETIQKRRAAKTTNLFVKKAVFEQIGMFPEGLRSGGDVLWTKAATSARFHLIFCKQAAVLMLPRGAKSLINKQYRVAKGQPAIWKSEGALLKNIVKKILLCWVPPNPFFLKKRIRESGLGLMKGKIIQLFIMGYFLRFVNAYGNTVGLLTKR